MIIGSGLLARAFSDLYAENADVCIYAAGVSNSHCTNEEEFTRERSRLKEALEKYAHVDAFAYFGTCSVGDPEAKNTPYVQHKLAMEQMVRAHHRHLILRLPQVAGKAVNPNTLLNFLHDRIFRGERFSLWKKTKRNIIDVDDVVALVQQLILDSAVRNVTVNVANTTSYPILDIVHEMERVVGRSAIYDVKECGVEYEIDVKSILPVLEKAGVQFGKGYLERVVSKYYKEVE